MQSNQSCWTISFARQISGIQVSEFGVPQGFGQNPDTLVDDFCKSAYNYVYIEVGMHRNRINPKPSESRVTYRTKRFRDVEAFHAYLNRLLAAGWITEDSYHRGQCLGQALSCAVSW